MCRGVSIIRLQLMRLLFAAATGGLLLCLAGCGTGNQPWASSAERDVRQRAENAGVAMARAGRHADAVEHARRVVGVAGDAQIELLEAEGTGMDGHVVLRVSSVYDDHSPLDHDSSARACFRYDFGDSGGGTRPDEVSCPDGDPLELPPPPFEPDLPEGAAERLTALLQAPDAAGRAQAAFPERGLRVQVVTQDGTVGIAVGAGPGECVMGRRLPDARIEVWHVPRIVAMPGEIGCDPAAAADGLAQQSPH